MADIIEINVKTPYLRPNYNFIIERMINEGILVYVHDYKDFIYMTQNVRRKGYLIGVSKVGASKWKVFLKGKMTKDKQLSHSQVSQEYLEKIAAAKKGEKIELLNRGQATYFMRVYNQANKSKKKPEFTYQKKENGRYELWIKN